MQKHNFLIVQQAGEVHFLKPMAPGAKTEIVDVVAAKQAVLRRVGAELQYLFLLKLRIILRSIYFSSDS